jgi:hypothetical protein
LYFHPQQFPMMKVTDGSEDRIFNLKKFLYD